MTARRTAGGPGCWRSLALCAGLALLIGPARLSAQETVCDPGDVEVRRLEFAGTQTFTDADLARGLVITPSGWLRRTLGFVGTRRCIDRQELRLDVARLALYYRKRGFFEAQVDTVVRAVADSAIAVRFQITEGPALRLDTLRVTGLDSVADRGMFVRGLGLREGERFDQYALDSARAVLTGRLRDNGYPFAEVLRAFSTHLPTRSATAELTAIPGPIAHIGDVRVEVTPREGAARQIPDAAVRGLLRLESGGLYRERDLVQAQRRLYQTDAYRHVAIALDSAAAAVAADSTVDVRVQLRETYMRSARAGVGYGTLDCFRLSAEYTNVNFLRNARRLELNARMSKIGVGVPLDVADNFCTPQVREDVYSDTLNYYAGATLRTPLAFGVTFPTVTVYSERRSEYKAFLRTTPVALGLARSWPRGLGVPLTMSYNLEYGRTEAQPALLCAAFNLCNDADRQRVEDYRRLAVLGASVVRDGTDDPVEPTRGSILRLDARHASRVVGSDPLQQFNQLIGNAAWYHAVADGATLAARLRVGAVLGSSFARDGAARFVPPQERLYAGGPTTVRGFRQNELGPLVYLANQYDTLTVPGGAGGTSTVLATTADSGYARAVPVGGHSVFVANLELRLRSPVWPELLQFTLFTDAGKVSRDIDFGLRGLQWTPGVGVRVNSPVGPLRMDVGYNRYDLPTGAAYFDAPVTGALAPLYCVSPGNRIPVVERVVDGVPVLVQEPNGAECPTTFAAATREGFLRRLTFNFSIGQAF